MREYISSFLCISTNKRLKHRIYLFVLFSVVFFGPGCNSNKEDVDPTMNYVKIYDDNRFIASYIPIDLVETSDKGFLILSGTRQETSDFLGIYLMKVDANGNFVRGYDFPANYVHPVPGFLNLNGTNIFFCMDEVSLQIQMFVVNEDATVTGPVQVNATYPMSANSSGTEIILLSYDNIAKSSVLSVINADGSILKRQNFSIGAGDGIEQPIIEHFTRTGRQIPFSCGKTSDATYYFNGFYNYTFSMVFTDLNSANPGGVLQGQRDAGGIGAVYPVKGNVFALSRFNYGDNYTLPNATIDMNSITSSVDLGGNPNLEWIPDAPADIIRWQNASRDFIIFGSTTKNSQIVLSIYDTSTGDWLGTDYLGFSSPYKMISMINTTDNGLSIVGSTDVAGRFARICTFKLSENNILDMISVQE